MLLHPDYETLRALDADNVPTTPSMTEEEINALPIHKYKVSGPQRLVSLLLILTIGYFHLSIWFSLYSTCLTMSFTLFMYSF